jgi:predicted  nucleic acid-binding Zn-ribbon protein
MNAIEALVERLQDLQWRLSKLEQEKAVLMRELDHARKQLAEANRAWAEEPD